MALPNDKVSADGSPSLVQVDEQVANGPKLVQVSLFAFMFCPPLCALSVLGVVCTEKGYHLLSCCWVLCNDSQHEDDLPCQEVYPGIKFAVGTAQLHDQGHRPPIAFRSDGTGDGRLECLQVGLGTSACFRSI